MLHGPQYSTRSAYEEKGLVAEAPKVQQALLCLWPVKIGICWVFGPSKVQRYGTIGKARYGHYRAKHLLGVC